MNGLTQAWLRRHRPALGAAVARLLYRAPNVRIGRAVRADSVPRILIDPEASLQIEDGAELRRNVEIRVHGSARVRIGAGARIDRGVRILAANNAVIDIAEGARIGLYSVLNGGDSITIGAQALVSGFVYLQTSMHQHAAPGRTIQSQGYSHAPLTLGADSWLGAHVVVLPGVTVGAGAVVGSNAVVTRDVAARDVVAGVPAKPIGSRSEEGKN